MRFKRGRKVEVFSQNEVPSGSWRCAEIACGNGHAYTVKYYGNLDAYGEAEEVFERVSRKAIRPCPPLMQVPENWSPGDLVEVFHYFSWKTATVLKILSRNQVLVRLLGTSQELKVGKLDIRVRLCWQGDEWIVIGKSCGNSEESRPNLPSTGKFNHNSGLKDATANLYFKDGRFATRNVNNFQEPDIIPSGKLKRRSPYCSQIGEYGPRNKIRVYEKEPRRLIFFVQPQPVLPKKVDDVASSRQLLDEKCIHPSFNNRLTGCFESNSVRETTSGAVGCSGAINIEYSDADSVASSVGSCSVFRNNYDRSSAGRFDENETYSDAESLYCLGPKEGNCLPHLDNMLTDEIHRLELHAYRRIMEALHASGPLSWEQETLLTNLRDSLHISNDEHLMEIRNLVSGHTGRLLPLASKCLKMLLRSAASTTFTLVYLWGIVAFKLASNIDRLG